MSVDRRKVLVVWPILVSMLLFGACTHNRYGYEPRRVVYVEYAPPEQVVEVVTVSPGAGYVWIPGHHRWDGDRYIWVSGNWRLAPRGRNAWIAGRWEQSGRGWYWVGGSWR